MVKSRYEKVYDVYRRLEVTLTEENFGQRGFFKHILSNLIGSELSAETVEVWGRDLFRKSVKYLIVYRRLINEFPEFRRGELTTGGYFGVISPNGSVIKGKENIPLDSVEYVIYSRNKLKERS